MAALPQRIDKSITSPSYRVRPISVEDGATVPTFWEVRLRGGDPPALDVWADYEGRCEWARVFFVWREAILGGTLDPHDYAIPPRVRRCEPGLVEVEAGPLDGLMVSWQTRVPHAAGLVIRLTATNRLSEAREVELYAISAIRLKSETLLTLPSSTPLRIVRDVITGSAAPGFDVAFALSGADAFGLRTAWLPLWEEIQSGQGLGNIVSQRAARERYAALACSPLLKPGESRELTIVQAAGSTLDEALGLARALMLDATS